MKRDKASISALERVSDELTASPDGLKVPGAEVRPTYPFLLSGTEQNGSNIHFAAMWQPTVPAWRSPTGDIGDRLPATGTR